MLHWTRSVQHRQVTRQRQEWTAYQARKKNQSKQAYDAQVAQAQAKAIRLRSQPDADDVIRGDALNALLLDLSDPRFTDSEWRGSKVALPEGLSIRGIVFRFAPKPGAKGSESLSRGVIALARLDVQEWPIVLRDGKLDAERKAYEAAYRKVRDECVAADLSLPTVLGVTQAIKALKGKATAVVATDLGFRKAAVQYVDQLDEATQMFHADTVEYASEIVKDTQEHDAATVGELLAFMRKYRLKFGGAEGVPGGADAYGQLYAALRQQKEALGIKDAPAPEARPAALPDDEMIDKIVAALTYVDHLDFKGNKERKPHKDGASAALNRAREAIKAKRSPKEDLLDARKHMQALREIGMVYQVNADRVNSASRIIEELLKTAG